MTNRDRAAQNPCGTPAPVVDMMTILDEAVDCWHKVADDHNIKHCNCFKEMFARRLIELGYAESFAMEVK